MASKQIDRCYLRSQNPGKEQERTKRKSYILLLGFQTIHHYVRIKSKAPEESETCCVQVFVVLLSCLVGEVSGRYLDFMLIPKDI